MSLFKVNVLTLFPEMFPGSLGYSLAGSALEKQIWQLDVHNIRDYSHDKHRSVDEKPFGGGAGMVMRPDVLAKAIEQTQAKNSKLLYMSPRGKLFNQQMAHQLIEQKEITIICGRFEGIDERVIDAYDIDEISLGDFVLSGGEIAAEALIDSCVRLLPGVIEEEAAIKEESFGEGNYQALLEYPHYTRPANWQGNEVPEVLLSGNHKAIASWRLERAKEITKERRPDLWQHYQELAGQEDK